MINDKKVLYSGMQATGNLTLGNYLGAMKNWVKLSNDYECFPKQEAKVDQDHCCLDPALLFNGLFSCTAERTSKS